MALSTIFYYYYYYYYLFFVSLTWNVAVISRANNVKVLNFTQRLNHFGVGGPFDNYTFQQQYVLDATYWPGPQNKGPFLVFLGGEAPISGSVGNVGVITKAAPRLGALVVHIEHRFYGTSVPYDSIDAAMLSPTIRSYLTSEQALADFAELILSLKADLAAKNSPVIVLGGSYSGMLAAWFRLKYPHIAVGALASSAPILLSEDIPPQNDFCSIVSRDFESINRRCSNMIRQSWSMIDEIASGPEGLDVLARTFNLCSNSSMSSYDLKGYLARMYTFAAQYNGQYNYWINAVCDPIVEASNDNVLEGVAHALLAMSSNQSCVALNATGFAPPFDVLDTNSLKAWNWQICSEIINIQGCNGYNSMLPPEMFRTISQYMEDCQNIYYISPRLDWVRTYYGGRDIRSGSNIVFSNGLMDPYSGAGILEDISDTIVAITTKEGSHCLDMNPARNDDPKWLVKQREKEIKIFEKWISNGTGAMKTIFPKNISLVIHVITTLLVLVYLV